MLIQVAYTVCSFSRDSRGLRNGVTYRNTIKEIDGKQQVVASWDSTIRKIWDWNDVQASEPYLLLSFVSLCLLPDKWTGSDCCSASQPGPITALAQQSGKQNIPVPRSTVIHFRRIFFDNTNYAHNSNPLISFEQRRKTHLSS